MFCEETFLLFVFGTHFLKYNQKYAYKLSVVTKWFCGQNEY